MSTNASNSERQRAWDRFQAARTVHGAAIEALRVLQALPDSKDFISASIRLRLRASPKYKGESLLAVAEEVIDTIEQEARGGFSTLRAAALVNICASFEYLLKAFFVDCAFVNEAIAAKKLVGLKIRLDAAEVLGLAREEQWFAIADRVFEELGKGHPTMSSRVQRFLLDCIEFPDGEQHCVDVRQTFDDLDCRTFNEAFLVRNCIVHNGGRTDTLLMRATNVALGTPIEYANGRVQELVKPIEQVADKLSPLWCLTL